MSTPIICHGCQQVSAVNRVTATLRCRCGSTDLDVWSPPEPGAESFAAHMGVWHGEHGTGFGQTMPDPLKGWSQYAGPMPGLNPFGHPATPQRCGNCHGSGWSLRERCRACGGSGTRTPPTAVAPEPAVARHPGQTKIPMVGRKVKGGRPPKAGSPPTVQQTLQKTVPGFGERGQKLPADPSAGPYESEGQYPGADSHSPHMQRWKPGPYADHDLASVHAYPMHDAPCPVAGCGHTPTYLTKDKNDDAWWACPQHGPLANIDKHPDIDPYADQGGGFRPQQGFRSRASKGRPPGRLFAIVAAVAHANPGLDDREVVGLARQTVIRYGE